MPFSRCIVCSEFNDFVFTIWVSLFSFDKTTMPSWLYCRVTPPHRPTAVLWRLRHHLAGEAFPRSPAGSRDLAVIHYQALSAFALDDLAVATLFQLPGVSMRTSSLLRSQIASILASSLPHTLFSSHRLPSNRWYRPTFKERRSAVVGCRSFGEGRTRRLRTTLDHVSSLSLLLRVFFFLHIYLALSSTWGIQTYSKVRKNTFFSFFNKLSTGIG